MVRWSAARRRTTFRLVVLALIAGVVLAAFLQLRLGAGHPAVITAIGAGGGAASADAPSARDNGFSISGSVSGLFPGSSLPLVLTVTNPHPFPIQITSIATSVGSPSPGCASSNLAVTEFAGKLMVPANSTANVTLTATLGHTTPDACQGAVFPLHYTGTAVKP